MKISKQELLDKYGISLGPGKYRVKTFDERYDIYAVKDDTEGCPLLGMKLDSNGIAPGTSKPAVKIVKAIIKQAIKEGQQVWIDVRNA